jgi:hypothetical protein
MTKTRQYLISLSNSAGLLDSEVREIVDGTPDDPCPLVAAAYSILARTAYLSPGDTLKVTEL